ncbi:MAG: hypothetical protein LBV17_01145 [Treponema sp.]|jgi:hypothetical protein|nr:hypothetical protein [Treponema sp.]
MKHIKIIISLLTLTVLLAGCSFFDEPEKFGSLANSSDKAQVKVSIGGNARTILPDFDWSFSKYVVRAEPHGSNSHSAPADITIPGSYYGADISVFYGEWIFTVTAYVSVGGSDYPAAKGRSAVQYLYDSDFHYVEVAVNLPENSGTGTFEYKVTYPSGGTANVSLEPLNSLTTPGTTIVIDNVSATSGLTTSKSDVASGMYFLTVKAAKGGKTVIRNEVVHIYQKLTSKADFIFTKLDFGENSINLGGTINIKLNGSQPDNARLRYSFVVPNSGNQPGDNLHYSNYINFDSNNGNGNGKFSLIIDDIPAGATGIKFFVEATRDNKIFTKGIIREVPSIISIPVDDKLDISLGNVNITVNPPEPLDFSAWVDGEITEKYGVDWYSINVTAGTKYYLWWNGNHYGGGDGSKTLSFHVEVFDTYGSSLLWGYDAWDDPLIFTAGSTGTVYISINGMGNTGTYAIACSTNKNFHNYAFSPVNVTPLNANAWVNGEITNYGGVKWYSINVTSGRDYYLWWNDSYDGDGSKTLDVDVYAWYDNEEKIIPSSWNTDSAWNTPYEFTAAKNGVVFIRVRPYSGNSGTGTYAIVYNTTGYRP